MGIFSKEQKFSRKLTVTLKEHFVPNKRIIGESVLLQYYVLAQGPDEPYAKQIGYVPVEPNAGFTPLCYFPMELAPSVQKQIDEIKERMRGESERKTAGEKVSV